MDSVESLQHSNTNSYANEMDLDDINLIYLKGLYLYSKNINVNSNNRKEIKNTLLLKYNFILNRIIDSIYSHANISNLYSEIKKINIFWKGIIEIVLF